MGDKRSILKNTLALSVPNVLNPLISFFLVLVISRYLGVKGLGEYSLVLSYMGIFATFASLGLADFVVREVARRPADAHKFFFNAGIFGSVSSLISLLCMDATVWVMGYDSDVLQATFLCSLSLVVSTPVAYMEAIFRSAEKSEYVALAFVSENIIRVAIAVWLLLQGYGIVPLFAVILGSRIFGFAFMFYLYVRVLGMPSGRYDPEIWRVLAREAPTFTSIAIFSTIHLSLGTIMLSKLKSIESVGIFSSADRLLAICKMFPVAFSSALLPFFTKRFGSGPEHLQRLSSETLKLVLLGTLPVVVGTMILAERIITTIYGVKFAAAGSILMVHIISLVPFSTVFILAQLLIATDNQRVDLTINIVAAVAIFVLNLVLIPYFAEMGVVLATLIAVLLFHQLQYWYIKKHLFPLPLVEIAGKALAASLAMGVFTYAIREWNLFLNVALSAVIYALLVVLLRGIGPEEMNAIAGLFKARKRREP
jgi:O-antigen/teichoic acid export membrane protein